MALDTRIEGDPESCRSAGRWLRNTLADGVHDVGNQLYHIRNGSNGRWTGVAADAFRQRMSDCGHDTDELRDDARSAGSAFESLADDMETAQRRMDRGRESAIQARLEVTDTQILHPGQGPGTPQPLPTDGSATDEQLRAYADAVRAQNAHIAKIDAYNRLAAEVDGARGVWERGKSAFDSVVNGLWDKRYLNAFNWTATYAGALEARRLFWQKGVDTWRAQAGQALRHMDETTQAARAAGVGNKLNFYQTIDAQNARYYDALTRVDAAASKLPSGTIANLNTAARSGIRSALTKTMAKSLARQSFPGRPGLEQVWLRPAWSPQLAGLSAGVLLLASRLVLASATVRITRGTTGCRMRQRTPSTTGYVRRATPSRIVQTR